MHDIVFPKGNEKEFILMAARLGYDGLCFVYDSAGELIKSKEELKSSKLKLFFGLTHKPKEKVHDIIVMKASGRARDVLERKEADIIYAFEDNLKQDYIHHRASGLNHVLCKIAREKNIAVGFCVSSILNAKHKSVLLGRIKQNIKLCRKYKVNMAIGSFGFKPYEMRAAHDLISLFCLLGMHPSEAKKAMSNI